MEIHSSSLAFIPAGYNVKNGSDQPQPSGNKENSADNKTVSASSSPTTKPVNQALDLPKLQMISDDIDQQKKLPANSRTARAVDAYIQENSQSLKNQRSELVTGIDLFA